MRFYHGTNSNALKRMAARGFRLLSRKRLAQEKIPVFSGEFFNPSRYVKGLGVDTVSLSRDFSACVDYANSGFDYMFFRKLRKNLIAELKDPGNSLNRPEFKERREALLRMSEITMKAFLELPWRERREVLQPRPIVFELRLDGDIDLKQVDNVGGLQACDQLPLLPHIRRIYTDPDGMGFIRSLIVKNGICNGNLVVDSDTALSIPANPIHTRISLVVSLMDSCRMR